MLACNTIRHQAEVEQRATMWAVLPVKSLDDAKQRLGGVLSPRERRALFRAMVEDVLAALSAVRGLDGIAVVSRDADIAALARRYGARLIVEDEDRGQTAAVRAAVEALAAEGVAGIITVPGDVPLVTPADIEAVLAAHGVAPAMTIVPARDDRGSNCIACSPPDVMAFAFGDDSFAKHLDAARRLGIAPRVVHLARLGLDVDTPTDLEQLLAQPGDKLTHRYLGHNGGAVRLGRRRSSDGAAAGPLDRAAAGDRLTPDEALALADETDIAALMRAAAERRDVGHGNVVSYSRKVFIPLTQLCRDVCHYCTFAHPPRKGQRAYMSRDEVLAVARAGAAAGCKEALFTLGDKPELRYRAAREELARLGHSTTIAYLTEVAGLVLRETGLLPHVNPGVMDADDIAALRAVSVSQGLMLESSSARLCAKGGPHYGSPDKAPEKRLETIRLAGEARVPFTSGILIGIGETRRERIESILALRGLHERYGHIQEIIVQNFRAKPGTRMAGTPEPDLDELLWSIAVARLIFGPETTVQAPPNLSPGAAARLVAAGVDDWGGVSPVTPDFVNPEAPWPAIERLAEETAAAAKALTERLAIYPAYARDGKRWLDEALRLPVLHAVDSEGFARTDPWHPGGGQALPIGAAPTARSSPDLDAILARASDGGELGEADIVRLFRARGGDVDAVCAAADELRAAVNGDVVSYVVNRNINYTNICQYRCGFCAFSKGKLSENLRGRPYDLDLDEIARRVHEAWTRGATEVCMQGGIHPAYTGQTYLDICRAVKDAAPDIHVHAFSPLEVWHGAETLGLSLSEFFARLREAGLSSLPGTAAEILDDEVRAVICPDKVNTAQWLEVMAAAHDLGLRSTATIMFGHVDAAENWARHLMRVRNLQKRTGGFTEFVPLPFVYMEAPLYLRGGARKGPTFRESLLMHAVARLALSPHITNIQASWPKMGPDGAAACLRAGVNDMGGTLMNESISRAAGASHGQELAPGSMVALIRGAGREPVQRTTLYGRPPRTRVDAAATAPSLIPLVTPPVTRRRRGQRAAE